MKALVFHHPKKAANVEIINSSEVDPIDVIRMCQSCARPMDIRNNF